MTTQSYSYLDVAILEPVRSRLAGGDALVLLSADLENVLWANGTGAKLLGRPDIESAMGAPSGLAAAQRRQIAATRNFPEIGSDRPLLVRLSGGMTNQPFLASSVRLPGGEAAILLAAKDRKSVV